MKQQTKSVLLGYMARDQHGQTYHLPNATSPRKALLSKFDRKHASKMYCDYKHGPPKHIGYIVAGLWLTLYEVREWTGKNMP